MDAGIPVSSMYAYAAAEPPYGQPGTDKQFEVAKEVSFTEGAPDYDMEKEENPESDQKMQEPPPIQKGPLFSLSQVSEFCCDICLLNFVLGESSNLYATIGQSDE